jgi:hypothetical protein
MHIEILGMVIPIECSQVTPLGVMIDIHIGDCPFIIDSLFSHAQPWDFCTPQGPLPWTMTSWADLVQICLPLGAGPAPRIGITGSSRYES